MRTWIVDEAQTQQVRQASKDQARHYLEIARTHRQFKGYHALMSYAHRHLQNARTFRALKEVVIE